MPRLRVFRTRIWIAKGQVVSAASERTNTRGRPVRPESVTAARTTTRRGAKLGGNGPRERPKEDRIDCCGGPQYLYGAEIGPESGSGTKRVFHGADRNGFRELSARAPVYAVIKRPKARAVAARNPESLKSFVRRRLKTKPRCRLGAQPGFFSGFPDVFTHLYTANVTSGKNK